MRLTIGIPTYKRPDCLRDALESVFHNITLENSHSIEILIADNEPGDTKTNAMIFQYQNDFPGLISYYQHSENIGFDANLNFIFNKAKTEYVWLLSDDDAMAPGAINKVLSVLNSHPDLSMIFVNYQPCDHRLDKKYSSDNDKIIADFLCASAEEFIKKSNYLFGLISSLVFSRDQWLTYYDKDYLGTVWIQVGMAFNILIKAPKSFVVHEKFILFRIQEPDKAFVWGDQGSQYLLPAKLYPIYEKMKILGYPPKVYRSLINSDYNKIFARLLCAIRDGANFSTRQKIAVDLISKYSLKLRTWFLYIPILFLPSFLLKKMYIFYKLFKKDTE